MKKFLSIAIVLAMLATSLFAIPVSAEEIDIESVTDWNQCYKDLSGDSGLDLSTVLTGAGTEANPYQIATASDLIKVAAATNNYNKDATTKNVANQAYYKMTANIDMSGVSWYGIGDPWGTAFTGTFDGNDYAIYNLSLAGNQATNGLFRVTGEGAVIKNVGIASGSSTVSWSGNADVNIGNLIGNVTGNVTITNCFNMASLTVTESASDAYHAHVGGLVGHAASGVTVTMTDCFNAADVTVTANQRARMGGLFGWAQSGIVSITNCFNTGNVTATVAVTSHVGGVVGWAQSGLTAEDCWNTGDITVNMSSAVNIAVGGICSAFAGTSSVEGCSSVCDIKVQNAGQWDGIGGLLGKPEGTSTIKNSSVGGTLTVTAAAASTEFTGLFAGYYGSATWENCTYSVVGTKGGATITDAYSLGDGKGYDQAANIKRVDNVKIVAPSTLIGNYAQNGVVEGNSVRFVSELAFSTAGFTKTGYLVTITYGDKKATQDLNGAVVYSSLSAAGETVTPEDGKYFIAYGISGIPADANAIFTITPYVVTLGGDTIYGETAEATMTNGDIPEA